MPAHLDLDTDDGSGDLDNITEHENSGKDDDLNEDSRCSSGDDSEAEDNLEGLNKENLDEDVMDEEDKGDRDNGDEDGIRAGEIPTEPVTEPEEGEGEYSLSPNDLFVSYLLA